MTKKWNEAKPAEKLLSLYTILLFNKSALSLSDLSAMLDCSKQTVSRLIAQLEGSYFGKVLRQQQGREALFNLDRPRQLPAISLNAEGLYQLAMCREFLVHLLPSSMQQQMAASLRQASAFLPEGTNSLPEGMAASFSKGHIDYAPFQAILQTIMQAIRENLVCSVRYKASLHGEEKSFDYAPKRLLAFRESILVQGFVATPKGRALPRYDECSPLSLHRLTACSLTRRSAAHIPDIATPNNAAFGVLPGELFTATIRFAPEAATYVAERQWSEDQTINQNDDDSITLNLQVQSVPECLAWVLSFGETAEVLSPNWLRNEMKKVVTNMKKCYISSCK